MGSSISSSGSDIFVIISCYVKQFNGKQKKIMVQCNSVYLFNVYVKPMSNVYMKPV